jgi:hypothetical protein
VTIVDLRKVDLSLRSFYLGLQALLIRDSRARWGKVRPASIEANQRVDDYAKAMDNCDLQRLASCHGSVRFRTSTIAAPQPT